VPGGASLTYSCQACLNNYSLALPLDPPRPRLSPSTFIVRHVRCEYSALATYHCLPTQAEAVVGFLILNTTIPPVTEPRVLGAGQRILLEPRPLTVYYTLVYLRCSDSYTASIRHLFTLLEFLHRRALLYRYTVLVFWHSVAWSQACPR
jgi:hypothetical protein